MAIKYVLLLSILIFNVHAKMEESRYLNNYSKKHPYKSVCKTCHSSKFELTRTNTKEGWHHLTSKDNEILKTIHKNNLAVLAYFNSSFYKPSKLYDDMEYYAAKELTEVKKLQKNDVPSAYGLCLFCHNDRSLAYRWVDREWERLLTSVSYLKNAHQNELTVLAYIDSKKFKEVVPILVKDMQLFAPERKTKKRSKHPEKIKKPFQNKMDTFKKDKVTFSYEKSVIKKVKAKQIFRQIKSYLNDCKFQSDININLYTTGSDISKTTFFTSMFVLGMAPVDRYIHWIMEIERKNEKYMYEVDVKKVEGPLSGSYKNEFIEEKIDDFMFDMGYDMNLSCKQEK